MKKIAIVLLVLLCCTACKTEKKLNKKELAAFNESIARGKLIYGDMCINCHMANGEGVEIVFPPLAKSDFLMSKRTASIRAIKFGLLGEIVVNKIKYNSSMSSLGLQNQEVSDVMNYITTSWGNKNKKPILVSEVAKIQK